MANETQPQATAAPGAVRNRGLITVSIMLATIMQVLDTTIANVSLPYMQGSLAASQDQIAWVLTSYIVAAGIFTPVTGWLGNRIGRKQLFLLSVGGFTLTSMLCGRATGIGEMVGFRLLQGVFGASLVPLSQAMLLDINPPERHGIAMAIWGSGIMVAPILGPTLGGWITENYSWRWVFYINLPIGILAFVGISLFVAETRRRNDAPFDLFGFSFLGVAVGALQLFLDRGEQKDWFGSTEIVVEAGVAAVALWVFIVHTATARRPFLDPALLKDRNFVAATVLMFAAGAVMYGTLALLPPLLTMLNYPEVTVGLLLAPRGITTMIFMMICGRLIGRLDIRLIVIFGLGVTGLSMWQMTGYSPQMDWWPIVTAGLVQGAGLGFIFVPVSTAAFSTLPEHLRGEGTGVYSLLRNVGGSIGISISETMLARTGQVNHAALSQWATPYNHALTAGPTGHLLSLHTDFGLALLNQMIDFQANFIGYLDIFKLMMIACFAALPIVLMLRPAAPRGGHAVTAE
jgi:MFS transporter, DHA2 family, multidrug resistance protein